MDGKMALSNTDNEISQQEDVTIPVIESDNNISQQSKKPMGKYELGHNAQLAKNVCYALSILRAVTYPLFKISLIALSNQVVKATLRNCVEPDLFDQLNLAIYGSIKKDSVTSAFLMDSLDFYQTFCITASLVICFSLAVSIYCGLRDHYVNRIEVKRLQQVFYDKFMSGSNTIDIMEARDTVYTKIATIEKYWSCAKFQLVDSGATILVCLILIFTLSWDLSLVCFLSMIIIGIMGNMIWTGLSVPWSDQRESKVSEINGRLLDLVLCKDVVLSHNMEDTEGSVLRDAIVSDTKEIHQLLKAKIVSDFVQNLTFTMMLPFLFLYVYEVEPTFERVFQLLIVMVIMDEVCRTYLIFMNSMPLMEEGKRAQNAFARVVRMDEEELFPGDFGWLTSSFRKKSTAGYQDFSAKKIGKKPLDLVVVGDTTLPTDHTDDSDETFHSASSIQSMLLQPRNQDILALEDVSLGYHRKDGSPFIVLEDLNLSFCLGQHYALMGETGAGKSTLLKALEGLVPTLKGHASVCGFTVDMTSSFWREQLAVVNQDSVLFNRTLRENLVYGQCSVSDEAIWDILDKLNLRDVISTLPRGLDTTIYHNGNEFSGGQKQRFQIARVLLNPSPRIVLMDEMTSALDTSTKKKVIHELKSFLVGKTFIMITHDAETLDLVDHVIDMSSHQNPKTRLRKFL